MVAQRQADKVGLTARLNPKQDCVAAAPSGGSGRLLEVRRIGASSPTGFEDDVTWLQAMRGSRAARIDGEDLNAAALRGRHRQSQRGARIAALSTRRLAFACSVSGWHFGKRRVDFQAPPSAEEIEPKVRSRAMRGDNASQVARIGDPVSRRAGNYVALA